MKSNFSPGAPVQSTSSTGIKFSRKSPAVGFTERHFPSAADFSDTEEKARVAVSSRWLASAAAEGLRKPPARDTGIGESLPGFGELGVAVLLDWGAGSTGEEVVELGAVLPDSSAWSTVGEVVELATG